MERVLLLLAVSVFGLIMLYRSYKKAMGLCQCCTVLLEKLRADNAALQTEVDELIDILAKIGGVAENLV